MITSQKTWVYKSFHCQLNNSKIFEYVAKVARILEVDLHLYDKLSKVMKQESTLTSQR